MYLAHQHFLNTKFINHFLLSRWSAVPTFLFLSFLESIRTIIPFPTSLDVMSCFCSFRGALQMTVLIYDITEWLTLVNLYCYLPPSLRKDPRKCNHTFPILSCVLLLMCILLTLFR